MADDPTGRSRPTTRRRRGLRSSPAQAGSDGASGLESAGAPGPDDAPTTAAVVDIWPMPDQGRTDHEVCPFLRSVGPDGLLTDPIDAPDPANRCAAMAEAVPQSLRQQELVCLTTAHASCPRYLRGATVETEAPVRRAITVSVSRLTPATVGALALLAAAFSASVVFALARGGLELPVAGAVPSGVPSPSPVAEVPSAVPSAAPSVEASTVPSPSATPSATPTPTAEPSQTPAPTPAPTATPAPTSDRYALLKPCPDTPDCWIYRVRSGDNLFSIARYFGVPLATVKSLNPWTANGLRVGRDLILPPPTR